MESLNKQLKSGILPRELNFNLESSCIDWNKLQYNNRCHSFRFYARKFPEQWSDDALFKPIIQMIADRAKINNKTPLNGLDELNNKMYNNIETYVFPNSSQQS